MRELVVVCPHARDFRAVEAAGLHSSYRVRFAGVDLDAVESFDARALVDDLATLPTDGVVGTKDRSALVAALVAERRRLRGPRPQALVELQHKPTARARQREAVPEATPAFAVVGRGTPPFPPPFFVKPVVGRLSQGARRIDDLAELETLEDSDGYAKGYAALAELAGFEPTRFHGFLAEELLDGDEVTLEGYVHEGHVTVIGITDSLKYAGTNSFEAFAYPTELDDDRQAELASVAVRLLAALGYDSAFFNLEFLVPEGGPAKIVEVNGRIASQFAPLTQAVDGRSTYDALFALACGDDPAWRPSSGSGAAVSYVVRVFDDAFVAAAPDPEEGVEILARAGSRLSEQGAANDVASYRLAIVYGAGATRDEALTCARECATRLSFRLERAR